MTTFFVNSLHKSALNINLNVDNSMAVWKRKNKTNKEQIQIEHIQVSSKA